MATQTQRETFKRIVQSARADLGISQRTLAEFVGVTPGAVAQWESGESAPRSAETTSRLEEALELDAGRLGGLLGHTPMPSDAGPPSVSDAVEADPSLDPTDRRLLLDLYRRLRRSPDRNSRPDA